MKKFVLILMIALAPLCVCAADFEDKVDVSEQVMLLTGGVDFDWVNMQQVKRDKIIELYRAQIFDNNDIEKIDKKAFRTDYKEFLKDGEKIAHYQLAIKNVKETPQANLASFFATFRDKQILYMYALQYKNNLKNAFYYDVLGNLRYVEVMSENYPNFPYHSVQYRNNGTVAGTIYFESQDTQYAYDREGNFKYLWHKSKMYDRNGKEIMSRTNW